MAESGLSVFGRNGGVMSAQRKGKRAVEKMAELVERRKPADLGKVPQEVLDELRSTLDDATLHEAHHRSSMARHNELRITAVHGKKGRPDGICLVCGALYRVDPKNPQAPHCG